MSDRQTRRKKNMEGYRQINKEREGKEVTKTQRKRQKIYKNTLTPSSRGRVFLIHSEIKTIELVIKYKLKISNIMIKYFKNKP